MNEDGYRIQDELENLLSYLASSDPDTMYLDQEMKHTDCKEFLNMATSEVRSNFKYKHWKILT